MVGIQTTEAINDLHKVTCGFWVCLSCVFIPKLLFLCVLITPLASPSVSSGGECQSVLSVCFSVGQTLCLVHKTNSCSPWRVWLQLDSNRITYLKCSWPSWLRDFCF